MRLDLTFPVGVYLMDERSSTSAACDELMNPNKRKTLLAMRFMIAFFYSSDLVFCSIATA